MTKEISTFLILVFAATLPASAQARWQKPFQKQINELDAEYPGQLGIYVKDLQTGETFNFRGDENWYFASGIKIVVAAEVLRQIDQGKFTLETLIKLEKDDFVDGAGEINYSQPGSSHPVRHLLEQMMMKSDNTASDVLIRKVGLDNVNALSKKNRMGRITLLSGVRRKIYGQIHPAALKLKNRDIIELSKSANDSERATLLEQLIQVPQAEWKKKTIEDAFNSYYAQGWNSGSLKSYSKFMSKLAAGAVLKPASTKVLLDIMAKTKTGEKRLKSGMGADLIFAHKTGTQRKRACDFGIVRRDEINLVLVSACVRGLSSTAEAEKALGRMGQALGESGLYSQGVTEDE